MNMRVERYFVVERRLNGIKIMSTNSYKISTTTNIEMQFILKIKETMDEKINIVTTYYKHHDPYEYFSRQQQQYKDEQAILYLIQNKSYICLLLHIHLNTFLLRLKSTINLKLTRTQQKLQELLPSP